MTPEKLNHYRRMLDDWQNTLREELESGSDATKVVKLDQQAIGRLSRMDALQHQAMAKASQARRTQDQRRIHAAIARMHDGEYGYCTDCGEDIDEARLNFDPALPKCLSCAAG